MLGWGVEIIHEKASNFTYPKLMVVKYSSKAHITGALQSGSFMMDTKPKINLRDRDKFNA